MSTDAFGKDAWVEMFREIGLDDGAMHRWHAVFERRWPEDHEAFLKWLKLPAADIARIRQASARSP